MPGASIHSPAMRWIAAFAIVATAVFAASLFGILTRPFGSLAALWPANAILLGLMVRNHAWAGTAGWTGAFCGYLAADLVTGGAILLTLWLTAANMSGVATGVVLCRFLDPGDRRLQRPFSMLCLFVVSLSVALVAALVGGGAAKLVYGRDFLTGFEFWFVTELVNSILILPVMLTFPDVRSVRASLAAELPPGRAERLFPLMTIVATFALCFLLGGPGAIMFPVPALLLCALSYGVFLTALATMLTCGAMLIAVSGGFMLPGASDPLASAGSVRLGVALMALGPLTVASVNAVRGQLMARLSRAANHDALTGILSRHAFMERGTSALHDPKAREGALLLLDVDHFKRVNDEHGHAAGDRLLIEFAEVVGTALRPGDVFGRDRRRGIRDRAAGSRQGRSRPDRGAGAQCRGSDARAPVVGKGARDLRQHRRGAQRRRERARARAPDRPCRHGSLRGQGVGAQQGAGRRMSTCATGFPAAFRRLPAR